MGAPAETSPSRWQQRERHPQRLTTRTVPCRAHRGRVTPHGTVHKPSSHRYCGSKTSHVHLARRDCPVRFGDDQRWRACSCGQLKAGRTQVEVDAWWDRHRKGLPEPEPQPEKQQGRLRRGWRAVSRGAVAVSAWLHREVDVAVAASDGDDVAVVDVSDRDGAAYPFGHLGVKEQHPLVHHAATVAFAFDALRCLRPHGHVEVANSSNQFDRRCLDPGKGFALHRNARTVAFENRAGERIELIRTRRNGQPGWVAVTGDKFDGRFFPTVSGGAGVDLFFRAAGTTWASTTSWSTTSGGGSAGVAPAATDRAIFEAASAACSIGAAAVCRSLDCTAGTGTYASTISGSGTLTFGDATAPTGNVQLKIRGTWTATGTVTFTNTGGGTNTADANANTLGGVLSFSYGTGTIQLTGAVTAGTQFVKGGPATLDTNGQTVGCATTNITSGTLTCGASVVTISGTSCTVTPTTLNAGTSEFKMTSAGTVTFTGTSKSFYKVTYDVSASALKTNTLSIAGDFTWTNTFKVGGNAVAGSNVNRPLMQSSTLGTTRTLTGTGGTFTMTGDVDFSDITVSGAPTFSNPSSCFVGDCQGNSDYLTCTTDGGTNGTARTTQTSTGTASFTWSTHGWTSRVPLPQDDVNIPNAFVGGRTITADMPRLGRSITCTCTGSPALQFSATSIFGSVTLASGMTTSGTVVVTLAGRSSYTFTSNTVTWASTLAVAAPSGTYTLADTFSSSRSVASAFQVTNGTFADAGNTVSFTGTTFSAALTGGTITMSGAWSFGVTGASTFWNNTGTTVNGTGSTVTLTAASVNSRTFAGGGQTYGTLTYTVAGSTGQLSITSSNTFSAINVSDATNGRTLSLANGTTTTCPNWSGVFGRSGANVTLTGGTGATIATTGGATMRFVTADHITATPSGAVYVLDGADGGSNAGLIFDPPDSLPQDIAVEGRSFIQRQAVGRAGRW